MVGSGRDVTDTEERMAYHVSFPHKLVVALDGVEVWKFVLFCTL